MSENTVIVAYKNNSSPRTAFNNWEDARKWRQEQYEKYNNNYQLIQLYID